MTVYILRKKNDPNFFKIGKAKTPTARMKAMKTASPDLYVWRELTEYSSDLDSPLEEHLHWLFSQFQIGNGGGSKECFSLDFSGYAFEMPDTLSQDTPEAVEFQLNMWIDTSFEDFDKFIENKDAASIYCQADGTTELYPEIEPTKDFEVLVERYAEAKKEMNRAAYEAEMIEAELKRIIGDNAGIKGLIAWPVVKSNRLDTKALKAEHPDLVDAYTKPSYTRRFTRVS